jgi:hypothetical protein
MEALKDAGYSPNDVVIAVVGTKGHAATWIGKQNKAEGAANLAVLARRLTEEATDQAMALKHPRKCPSCQSRRFGPTMRGEGGTATCMDCGHVAPAGLPR